MEQEKTLICYWRVMCYKNLEKEFGFILYILTHPPFESSNFIPRCKTYISLRHGHEEKYTKMLRSKIIHKSKTSGNNVH